MEQYVRQKEQHKTNDQGILSKPGTGPGGENGVVAVSSAHAASTAYGRNEPEGISVTQRCGSYLRISREDPCREWESNSISSQRLVIQEYLHDHPGWSLEGEWVDDGVSGSRFDRPGLRGLLQAAKEGEIDCIIVKDLSRFGREYIQTGQYLRQLLPQWGVRFVSVGDGYDSAEADFCEETLLVPILNLMNDAYCRDISRKVRNGQNARRRQGDYVGAFAPYGYQKKQEDHHRLEIEKDTALVVQKIFCWRSQGHSAEKIAGYLDALSIPTPYLHKQQMNTKFVSGFVDRKEKFFWSPVAVRRILKNEIYKGILQQGKSRKISHKLQKRQKMPQSEWISVPGGVPQIISEELFQQCQGRLQ